MSFNVIDKKMIVKNTIEMQPEMCYVSASLDCNFLDKLSDRAGKKITGAGIFGDLSSTNINLSNNRIFNINDKFFLNSGDNTLEKIQSAKDFNVEFSNLHDAMSSVIDTTNFTTEEVINFNISVASSKAMMEKNNFTNMGIQKLNNSQSFKVERLEKKYIIDNLSYKKKRAAHNLFQFYRENIKYDNFHDIESGFTNYNSLNFFSLRDNINSNFSENKTHSNCVIYPNMLTSSNSSKQTYDFTSVNEMTFSFFINPKRTNNPGYHYNPGCIVNIPGVISAYLVKGTSVDQNKLTDKFRVFIETGDETYNQISQNFANFNITNENPQQSNLSFLSSNDILSLNNWHNVCVSLKSFNANSQDFTDVTIYVDGVLIDEFQLTGKIQNQTGNSFITIGNKIEIQDQNSISNFVLYSFSKDKSILNDNEGPYVVKHIDFGNDFNPVLNTAPSDSIVYSFKNSLNTDNSDYIGVNTSLSLNAEIVDIRIYDQFIDKERALYIYKNGIVDKLAEIDDLGLKFWLPVYFKSQSVKRKGLINLSAPYQKFYSGSGSTGGSGPILGTVDEYLTGDYYSDTGTQIDSSLISSEVDFRVKTGNISYNFPINPFFLNFTGGTEVSVEHFLREFVKETQPNLTFGGKIREDRFQDCFLGKKSTVLNSFFFNNISKTGKTANDLSEYILKNLSASDLTNLRHDYQFDNIFYKNYMILPCDNGIQKQSYNEKNFSYTEEDMSLHKDSSGVIRYDYVTLENVNKSCKLLSTISRRNLVFNEYYEGLSKDIISESERLRYNFKNKVLSAISFGSISASALNLNESFHPSFYESASKIKNISLSNFFNEELNSYINDNDLVKVRETSLSRRIDGSNDIRNVETLLNTNSSFYKTHSNPAQRSFYSSYDNAVSNSRIYDYKNIGEDNNIVYKKIMMPLWQTEEEFVENCSTMFFVSNQLFNKKIKRESLTLKDVDIMMSSGLEVNFKDSKLGTIYRNDSLTEPAKWNSSGNILYNEGIISIMHPSLYNFGKTNFELRAKSHTNINVFELNLPAHSGETNLSKNISYNNELRMDDTAFNSDESFVYITDIDLHDENLNIIASAKLAKPFAKKNSDNILFRLKMDFWWMKKFVL